MNKGSGSHAGGGSTGITYSILKFAVSAVILPNWDGIDPLIALE